MKCYEGGEYFIYNKKSRLSREERLINCLEYIYLLNMIEI